MRYQTRLLVVLVVFFLVFVLIVFDFETLERGQRQRLAEQIAFRAHPEADDVIALHLCDGERLAAGFYPEFFASDDADKSVFTEP